ncbi:MAG: hypothetical protein IIA67_12410 [Planctomycetes bacterium]|nr:hypothetical protein [Planctomycetota bacterium]
MRIHDSIQLSDLGDKLTRVFDLAGQKIQSIDKSWDPADGTPVFTVNGTYTTRGWTEWTQGFQFGCAVLQYDATDDVLVAGTLGRGAWILPNAASLLDTTIVGRHLFYDNSKYDKIGFTPAPGINPEDALAIAIDKTAYLPGGGLIGIASMSAYTRGINGIFVDLTGPHGTLSLADFEFAMSPQGFGANTAPSTWALAPAPIAFTVLADTPVAGTDRVEFIWADNAIEKRYLEVTTKGNDAAGGFNTNTGLAASDYFYYGNQFADNFLGTGGISFITSGLDSTDAGANIGFGSAVTNIYDYNKDGLVSALDQQLARDNPSFLRRIDVSGPPPPAPAAAEGDDGSGSAVASALTIPSLPEQPGDRSSVTTRLSGIEPRGDPTTGFFQHLGEADGPRAKALSTAVDDAVDRLDLSDDLLRSLLPNSRLR